MVIIILKGKYVKENSSLGQIIAAIIGAFALIIVAVISVVYSSEKNQDINVTITIPQKELTNYNNTNLIDSNQVTPKEKKVSASKELPQEDSGSTGIQDQQLTFEDLGGKTFYFMDNYDGGFSLGKVVFNRSVTLATSTTLESSDSGEIGDIDKSNVYIEGDRLIGDNDNDDSVYLKITRQTNDYLLLTVYDRSSGSKEDTVKFYFSESKAKESLEDSGSTGIQDQQLTFEDLGGRTFYLVDNSDGDFYFTKLVFNRSVTLVTSTTIESSYSSEIGDIDKSNVYIKGNRLIDDDDSVYLKITRQTKDYLLLTVYDKSSGSEKDTVKLYFSESKARKSL